MTLFGDCYRGRRVLVTGHTGFKGSWLALWLQELGAHVTGVALPPETERAHWDLLRLGVDSHYLDIRDGAALSRLVQAVGPDVVFHLAAQPLVRRSYRQPVETWASNVMGTVNLLEACRAVPGLLAIVAVTTDKCYENREWEWGYREDDPLGGHDPYSASKAGAELVVASYRASFFNQPDSALLASARAGNVIGGGDWSEDRLIPDLIKAISAGAPLEIRSPRATRPWQHVLESLAGYLLLGQKLIEGQRSFATAWNFGPDIEGNRTVEDVLVRLRQHWPALAWHLSAAPQPHEANFLYLDSSRARQLLGWRSVWSLDQSLGATADWYQSWLESGVLLSREQLQRYINAAHDANASWVHP